MAAQHGVALDIQAPDELSGEAHLEHESPGEPEVVPPAEEPVGALPVYDFGTYIGEDRYQLPGPSGPAPPRV